METVDPIMVEILREKTEGERLCVAWGMWKSARDMLRTLLRAEHPDWGQAQVERETARRLQARCE
jgi:hypothetical protein